MLINLEQLRAIMKESGLAVYRDSPSTTATYPYIVYEYVNETHKRASNKVLLSMPMYQVSVITDGIESDYEPLKNVFDKHGVVYSQFIGYPYDENDDTVTQFITNVRCVN